jgi:hypothetical protein
MMVRLMTPAVAVSQERLGTDQSRMAGHAFPLCIPLNQGIGEPTGAQNHLSSGTASRGFLDGPTGPGAHIALTEVEIDRLRLAGATGKMTVIGGIGDPRWRMTATQKAKGIAMKKANRNA